MTDRNGSSDALWLWFAVSSVVCLAVLAISPVKDYFREYRRFQNAYRERLLAAAGSSRELAAARSERVEIRQIWIPELAGRVDRCVSCHLGVENPALAAAEQPLRPHPPTPHTPHDFSRFGCTSCHRGQGRATSVAAAHGEVSDWTTPLLPLRYTEASCGTCHLGDGVPEASLLSAGRALMRRAACFGCHELRGQEDWRSDAPDLDGLARKTRPEWLRAWLRSPRQLRPGTLMPEFDLSDAEIEALVAFLWVQPAPPALEEALEEPLPPGDAARGGTLFRESRCISCHTVEGRGHGSAPELAGIGSAAHRGWLAAFVSDPQALQPGTSMPRYAFAHQDLLDLSQYLADELVDPAAPPVGPAYRASRKLAAEGEDLYRKYGCGGCHRIGGKGADLRMGPELTGIGDKPVGLLDFGDRDDLPRRLPEWLAAKVAAPRTFRAGLKMPNFGFTPQQIEAIVTALLSQVAEPAPAAYRQAPQGARYAPAGRYGELVRRYACLSCHQVQGAGGDISTAPLTFEGSKVRKDWLASYLLVPSAIRPLLVERMIPLRMPPEEATFLADFMDNVYLDDGIPGDIFSDGVAPEQAQRGRRLFHERYGCQACHQVGGAGGYYGPPLDDTPGKLKPGWIAWWLQGPQRWRRDVRCPDYGLSEEDARDLTAYLVSLPAASGIPGTATGGQP